MSDLDANRPVYPRRECPATDAGDHLLIETQGYVTGDGTERACWSLRMYVRSGRRGAQNVPARLPV